MPLQLTNNQILLKECVKQEFEESSGYHNPSNYFEYFAASQVLKNHNLSDEEIDSGNTGGGNDGGCDNIYVFLNDELITADQIESLNAARGSVLDFYILQAKYMTKFSEDVILKWKTTSDNLLDMSKPLIEFEERYNESTIEAFGIFRDVMAKLIRNQIKIRIHYYYISLGTEVHNNVKRQADELRIIAKRHYPTSEVNVIFVGADQLMEMYSSVPETTVHLDLADQPISLSENEYIGLVKLGNYYKFITDDNYNLRKSFFEANVRDYQGNNSVNSCIADTLQNKLDEDFWWLNNGITILSASVNLVTNKSLQIVNPEIVNGLQTSREIYNFFSAHQSRVSEDSRNVLVRIIRPSSEESRDNIIFSTNNQTSIPKSSLRATDPIHLQIEMYFKSRGLYYDRRKNYYKNLKKKPKDIVSLSFLAQCLISLLLRKPDYARARPSTLLTDEETYKLLYEENQDLETFYKAALIGKKVQNVLKANGGMTMPEQNDILFYVIYVSVANKLSKQKLNCEDLKSFDIDSLTESEIISIGERVFRRYKDLGGDGRVAKNAAFIETIYHEFDL